MRELGELAIIAPPCPACRTAIPFKQTLWGLGRPFTCKGCGTRLIVPQNFWIAPSAMMAYFALRSNFASITGHLLLITVLGCIILLLTRLLVHPETV